MSSLCISPESVSAPSQASMADAWMKRGLALLSAGSSASISKSIPCFDRAIALRRDGGDLRDPWLRFGLIGGWINRADALTRLGTREDLKSAAESHSTALKLLEGLSIDAHPLFRERHAIAWLNHGVTLHAMGTPSGLEDALVSFQRSIGLLSEVSAKPFQWNILLGSAWMNHGNTLIGCNPSRVRESVLSARRALSSVAGLSHRSPQAAEIDLTARHILCRAVALQIALEPSDTSAHERWRWDASQVVREGLRLSRHWRSPALMAIRRRAMDLFRFGIRILEELPADSLAQFLLESLDPERSPDAPIDDAEMHVEATLALWRRFRSLQVECLRSLGSRAYSECVESLSPLAAAESRLLSLRDRYFPGEFREILGADPSRGRSSAATV